MTLTACQRDTLGVADYPASKPNPQREEVRIRG